MKKIHYDWVDSLLFFLVFLASIALTSFLSATSLAPDWFLEWQVEIVAGLALGVFAARRKWFAVPSPGFPKKGFLWSLLSVFGLFLTFGGALAVMLGGMSAKRGWKTPPDFYSEAVAYTKRFPHLKTFTVNRYPGESQSAARARLERSKKKRAGKRKARIEKREREQRLRWMRRHNRLKNEAVVFFGVGFVLFALGAFLQHIRFQRGEQGDEEAESL